MGEANSQDRYYDQIAWFTEGEKRRLPLAYIGGGYVNFLEHLYKDIALDAAAIQYRVSDHFPLWVEFGCRSEETIKRAQEQGKKQRSSGKQAPAMQAGVPLAAAAAQSSAN